MRKLMLLMVIISSAVIGFEANASVKAYFNQNTEKSYREPYRGFNRPGDNLEKVLVDQIKSAKKSIFIAVQELRLPKVAKALAYQKSMGREVKIILENSYNNNIKNFKPAKPKGTGDDEAHDSDKFGDLKSFIDINHNGKITRQEMDERDAIHILSKAGIDVIDDTYDGSLGSSLMHHKFVIIDRKKVVISSANFTLSGVHGDFTSRKSLGNDNSMIVIKSTELANFFFTEFSIMWGGSKGPSAAKFGVNKPYRGTQVTYLADNTEVKVMFSPTSLKKFWRESTNGLIAKEISKAKKSVSSALFVFSSQRLVNTLEKAQKRGIKIQVMAEPKFAFRDYSEVLDMFGIALPNAKCELEPDNKPWRTPLENVGIAGKKGREGDLLHHKYAVIDDEKVIFGSHNWSDAANHKNDEFLLVIENRMLAKSFKKEFARIKSNSKLGAPKWLSDRAQASNSACGTF